MMSMNLFLFCPEGHIRSLWLPRSFEGRYLFESKKGQQDLPFYVEAVTDRWVMYCGDSGSFFSMDSTQKRLLPIGSTLQLQNRAFSYLMYNERYYAVFSEFEQPGDRVFIPYYFEPLPNVDYSIGRNPECLIEYKRPEVSRHHADIKWNGNVWEIIDKGSTNGVYINGKKESQKVLHLGDIVFIMGLMIVVGSNYFAINNANNRISINTPHIRRITALDKNSVVFSAPVKVAGENRLFDRPPRKLIKCIPKPIEIEMPPMRLNANKLPLLLRLGSPVISGGQALMTGNYLAAISSMVLPSMSQGMTEKDRKEYEEKRTERYGRYLDRKVSEIDTERIAELKTLNMAHPGVQDVLSFATDKARLWERRKIDEDFLSIRIGTGNIPLLAERVYNKKRFDLDDDELVERMYSIAEKPVTLNGAPILLSLIDDYVIGITGSSGKIIGFIRNMILQLVTTHSYDELKICILADEPYAEAFDFVKYLRHNWDDERTVRFFATSLEDTPAISNYFNRYESEYFSAPTGPKKRVPPKVPAVVVFALSKSLFESLEFLKTVLDEQEYHGITVLNCFDGLPKECTKIINADSSMKAIDLKHPENPVLDFSLDSCNEQSVKMSIGELYKTKIKTNSELAGLPSMITFLEMFNVGRVEHLNPMVRWSENDPIKSLAARIGVGPDGSLFTLDLHEKRQGPHGLIAGMTGSGKSEFIITYILSMAVNFSPEEVAFILIDYKGGGLADAFEDKSRGIHLPHLVGTITNLDGAAIQRSLLSINSELKRRQTIFKHAKSATNSGTMDIYDYQRFYRNKSVKEPLPHLFIISDEFAELKKQQPEFMDELISTARIGRSLGVHLILATQKPAGVVNDQIWSNTKFRVCLKVQDRGDSMEMLKRPEAAELRHTGRFYLQVGYNEYFALGQSAWCGAGYYPQDEVIIEKDNAVEFIDNSGQLIHKAVPKVGERKSEGKQIVSIVKYLSELAIREGIQAKPLWLEPLPPKLELNTLLEETAGNKYENITALIGMVDDPEKQSQYRLEIDMQSFRHMLICGPSGSGKSTFIRTMLYSLISRYSPEEVNYYIFDLSAGALGAFSKTPHCGAYVIQENEADFDRILALVKELVNERKRLFAEAEVFGYNAYVKLHKLPLVLVIIDGWTNIASLRKGQEYNLNIHTHMKESSNYGIRFILSINGLNDITVKAKNETSYQIALRAKDKFDYNDILGVRGAMVPPSLPGRGLCVIDKRPLEYHTAVPNCDKNDQTQNALLKESLRYISERYAGCQAAKILPVMDNALEYVDFCKSFPKERIPLGFSMETMQPIAIPLQQLYNTGIFFGNPIGIHPVLLNIIYSIKQHDADLIVMRRKSDTVFDAKTESQLITEFGDRFTLLETTHEDIARLDSLIIGNIQSTKKQFRDEYCDAHGIPATDKGRTKRAAKYIRENSRPLFVLFESLVDFATSNPSDSLTAEFNGLFGLIKGYNTYFIGCFYPDDDNVSSNALIRTFMKEDFALIFGGRFNKVWFTQLPPDFKRLEKVHPAYNRFIMKYRSESYRMVMPCGELLSKDSDPDEVDII